MTHHLVRKLLIVFPLLLLGLVFVPPLVHQSSDSPNRQLHGTTLEELEYREITFPNKRQNLQLGGMLFTPEGNGPFPAVVIIHGSGTSHRENIWYLTLTRYLQENGILVLLPDKRGSEKSEGDWRTASFEDLATDTLSAVEWLEGQSLPVNNIGIIGMSQGGHIAPVAARSQDFPYIVNMVGASVSMHEQFQYEETNNLRQMGVLPGIANMLAYLTTFIHREITSNKKFWHAIGNYDPIPDWAEVQTDTLVLYGEADTNVPVQESVERFQRLNNPGIQVKTYSGSGHALEDPPGQGNQIIRQDVLQEISSFIHDHSL